MGIGEWIAWTGVLLLALYGCACLIRRLCLRVSRCPDTVRMYRVAVPRTGRGLEPLFRCLQAQAAWHEELCGHTMVVLPPLTAEERRLADRLIEEHPAIQPVTLAELSALMEAWQED